MAIKINNNTVIDDSQNIISNGTISGGIIATTAEAQEASSDSVIMTPLKVKEAIQGGTISVIKSAQRFTLSTNSTSGRFNTMAFSVSSHTPGIATLGTSGDDFIFVNLPITVSIFKSFLTMSVSGVVQNSGTGTTGEVSFGARLYTSSGSYGGNQVQIVSKTGNTTMLASRGFEIYVEVVEFY